jgi:hypothetical protein
VKNQIFIWRAKMEKLGKYGFIKVENLNKSLIQYGVDDNIRKKIMENGELIKATTSPNQKIEWLSKAMQKMDELIEDVDLRKNIRQCCACSLSGKRYEICKEYNKKYETPEEKINALNDIHFGGGHEIKIIAKGKYQVTYFDPNQTEFKCVCIKNVTKKVNISKTYCYCGGGHNKYFLEMLFGKKLNVEMISSALTSMGKKNCIFVLEEINE